MESNRKLVIFFSEILGCYVAAVLKKFSEYIHLDRSGVKGWQYLCNGYNYGSLKGHICAYKNICTVVHSDFHKEILKVKYLWNDHAKISRYMCGQSNTLGFIRLKTSLILSSKYMNWKRLRKPENLDNI